MAMVRCLGCGEVIEARASTVACPSCGTVMQVTGGQGTGSPPGVARPVQPLRAQGAIIPPAGAPIPMAESAPRGPLLGSTAKLWIGIVVGILAFGLFIDWFRLKIAPVKKVVDQAQVEQLAHDLSLKEVGELRDELEKLRATTRQAVASGVPTGSTPPSTVVPAGPQVRVGTPGNGLVGSAGGSATGTTPGKATVNAGAGPKVIMVRNEAYVPYAALVPARPTDAPDAGISDAKIDETIKRGLDWLAGEFARRRLKSVESYDPGIFPGADAIAVYGMLVAGQAVRDERVRPTSVFVREILDGLKELPMEGGKDTYGRSLRISALSVLNRKEDRTTLDADARWLLESSVGGAFSYTKQPAGTQRSSGNWDNSNSQYGGLGLWMAAETGYRVPAQFWRDVENHWTDSQVKISGGWGYRGGPATVAMTCAGATMLMVARDQTLAEGTYTTAAAPLSKPIERALDWLDEGDHTVQFSGHTGYTLYGLERVGLASGYKFFGKHDWYRELAGKVIETQEKDGRWVGEDGEAVETAFRLLFLSRGREPIFMGKLRWEGPWANRPRDVAALCRFAGRALERSVNWQVLGLQRDWTDWTDAPALLITSDQPPQLTEADVAKLRKYALAGGLVFTQAENGSEAMNGFAQDLAKRMFPEYAMETLPATHAVYSAMFPQAPGGPSLMGVSNGSRLLMVHSPTDLSKQWGTRPPGQTEKEREKAKSVGSELATNVVVYATGKRDLRRRTDPPFLAERAGKPVGVIPVARLKYEGNWDPEPWGWERVAREFDRETSIALRVKPVEIVALEPKTAPVAHLTGVAAHTFDEAEAKTIREYVEGGGVLLVDSCGGSAKFAESVRTTLLAKAFPNATASVVRPDHPLMGKGRAWMSEIPALLTRGDAGPNALRVMRVGNGAVVMTDLDVSTGLLGMSVLGVNGYDPSVAERLVKNLVVWAVWPEGAPAMPVEGK